MKTAWFTLFLLITGCASAPGPAVPVQVPVTVPCVVDPPGDPEFPSDETLLALDEYSFVISLWMDRRLRSQYEAKLKASTAGCL